MRVFVVDNRHHSMPRNSRLKTVLKVWFYYGLGYHLRHLMYILTSDLTGNSYFRKGDFLDQFKQVDTFRIVGYR